MRRLVAVLVRHYFDAPGAALTTEELFRAAWPGDNVSHESLQSRVYMALSRLRAFGLEGVVVHTGAGYRIAPDVLVNVSHDG